MTERAPKRDVEIVWLPEGRTPTGEDFAAGERYHDLDGAIIFARECVRADRALPWIRCDGKFVLSPQDVVAAYAQLKGMS